MLGVRLPEQLESHLKEMSQKTGLSKSTFAIEALRDYLEDEYFYHEAIKAYEEHLRKGEKTISWEEAQKKLGLLDHDHA